MHHFGLNYPCWIYSGTVSNHQVYGLIRGVRSPVINFSRARRSASFPFLQQIVQRWVPNCRGRTLSTSVFRPSFPTSSSSHSFRPRSCGLFVLVRSCSWSTQAYNPSIDLFPTDLHQYSLAFTRFRTSRMRPTLPLFFLRLLTLCHSPPPTNFRFLGNLVYDSPCALDKTSMEIFQSNPPSASLISWSFFRIWYSVISLSLSFLFFFFCSILFRFVFLPSYNGFFFGGPSACLGCWL